MQRYWIYGLILSLSLMAQGTPTRLHGEIFGLNPGDNLYVEVYEQGRHVMIDRVPVFSDGRFEVKDAQSEGHYEVRVVGQNGETLHSEYVSVTSRSSPIEIRLPPQAAAKASSGGPVSVYRLQHQVPRKAVNEFKKAELAWKAGKKAESIQHLENALQLDPGFMEAHNNLGAKLLAGGERGRAEQEFRKSIELDPGAAPGHLNLAICLLIDIKSRDEARESEMHARKALQLDPASVRARYAVGIALAALNSDEALPYLREAADQYPQARLAAASMLDRLGRAREAKEWREQTIPPPVR